MPNNVYVAKSDPNECIDRKPSRKKIIKPNRRKVERIKQRNELNYYNFLSDSVMKQ